LFLHAAGNWPLAAGGIASGMKIRFQKEYFIGLLAPGKWPNLPQELKFDY
jgi:hypothetical protein